MRQCVQSAARPVFFSQIHIVVKFIFDPICERERGRDVKTKAEGGEEIEGEVYKKWNIFNVWQESNNLWTWAQTA